MSSGLPEVAGGEVESFGVQAAPRTPSRRGHLERLTGDYGRAHGIAHERARRWLSLVSFAGALDSVRADDGARFLIKGGASMELRLGLGARTTKDIDVVFRGAPREMLDALEEAFAQPYGNFSFRRKGPVEDIRETGSRRLLVQVGFAGKDWQTLQIEVARPEATEAELVPVAIGIADFRLDGPERVACLALRYQVAQKIHAVTEQPDGRTNHRFWDLIDLQLQRELLGNDLARVREAASRSSLDAIFIPGRRSLWFPTTGASPTRRRPANSTPTCHLTWIPPPTKSATSSPPSTRPGVRPRFPRHSAPGVPKTPTIPANRRIRGLGEYSAGCRSPRRGQIALSSP